MIPLEWVGFTIVAASVAAFLYMAWRVTRH